MNTTGETANRNRWWKPEPLSKSLQQEKLTHLLHLKEMIYLFSLTSPSDRLAHGLNWSGQQQIISLANRGYCPQSNDPSFSLSLKEQPNIFPSPPTRPLLHLLPALNLARHRSSIYPHWKKLHHHIAWYITIVSWQGSHLSFQCAFLWLHHHWCVSKNESCTRMVHLSMLTAQVTWLRGRTGTETASR